MNKKDRDENRIFLWFVLETGLFLFTGILMGQDEVILSLSTLVLAYTVAVHTGQLIRKFGAEYDG